MYKSNKKEFHQAGFSLIELIIVISIVSILAALAFSSAKRNLQLFRLETGSGTITSFSTLARLEAIKRNREVTVEIDKTKQVVNLKSRNYKNEVVNLLKNQSLPEGIVFQDTAPASLTFTSLGRNKTNGETIIPIQLKGTSIKKQIKVSAVGVITTTNN